MLRGKARLLLVVAVLEIVTSSTRPNLTISRRDWNELVKTIQRFDERIDELERRTVGRGPPGEQGEPGARGYPGRDFRLRLPYVWNFTSCGRTSNTVPTYADCLRSYKNASEPAPPGLSVTSGIQTFTVPVSGHYKLETYGAAGGDSGNASAFTRNGEPNPGRAARNNIWYGGRGGYAYGEMRLTAGETIYVAVGQQGEVTDIERRSDFGDFSRPRVYKTVHGGFNGGGSAINSGSAWYTPTGGGGATDIRRSGYGLTDRIVVAGGGGGIGPAYDDYWLRRTPGGICGGPGGGYKGGNGLPGASQARMSCYGTGGTQTAGGDVLDGCYRRVETSATSGGFGYGGSVTEIGDWPDQSGGGGGGYFGGGAGGGRSCGGGGSSFTSTDLSNAGTAAGVRRGDGLARITLVSLE